MKTIIYNLKLKEVTIICTINFKKVKNYNLRINNNKEVSLSVPSYMSQKKAIEFITSKKDWIQEKINKLENTEVVNEIKYMTGDKILLRGNYYTLNIIKSEADDVYIITSYNTNTNTDYTIIVHTINTNSMYIKRLVDNYTKLMSYEIFSKSLDINYLKFENYNIQKPKLKIKYYKSMWGNYNKSNNTITININLIQKDLELIDYVIVHELCHTVHLNHSKDFYNLFDTIMLNNKELRKKLNS